MGQLPQSVREHPPKSFPSYTETNSKQCMTVTLRSGKDLEESKKNSNEEEQPEDREEKLKLKKKMEAKLKRTTGERRKILIKLSQEE